MNIIEQDFYLNYDGFRMDIREEPCQAFYYFDSCRTRILLKVYKEVYPGTTIYYGGKPFLEGWSDRVIMYNDEHNNDFGVSRVGWQRLGAILDRIGQKVSENLKLYFGDC